MTDIYKTYIRVFYVFQFYLRYGLFDTIFKTKNVRIGEFKV